jgi:hypothetical protein
MFPANSPDILCQYPALSRAIRRQDIQEGPNVFVRNFSEAEVFGAKPLKDVAVKIDVSGPYEMSAEEGMSRRAKAVILAAAVGKTGLRFTKDDQPDESIDLTKYIDLNQKEIHSITGELFWDYGNGFVTANAPRTQAALGFIQDRPISLNDCDIRTGTKFACILVTSWDGKDLKDSKHILITAVGRVRNSDMLYSLGGQRLIERGGGEDSELILEGVKGTVALKQRSGACAVTALSPYGYKTADVTTTSRDGKIVIPLDGRNKAVYYEVTFE